MARHYWITVRPSEGRPTTFEAITFEGAYDIARREAARWLRGVAITVESVPVRRVNPRVDFEGTATRGEWTSRGGARCSG